MKNTPLACVRAAIDAQRAIHELNQKRLAENPKREAENRVRRFRRPAAPAAVDRAPARHAASIPAW